MPTADPHVERTPVRCALLSVFYKDGVVELARALHEHGAALLSTGGTMKAIAAAGIPVKEVADHTGFPEMMDGRVKTLHPRIHGGLLGRRDKAEHLAAMEKHSIAPIDLVCVNLYPFEETVATPGATREEIIEKIDIGGPSMLRSAAKNHDAVAVLCDPADYAAVIAEVETGGTTPATRRRLAAKAFTRTGTYDTAISEWFAHDAAGTAAGMPEQCTVRGGKVADLRYGENPHQQAAFYRDGSGIGLGGARVLTGGKELSYNNYLDLDGAIAVVNDLPSPAAVVVKHTNPCGAAVAESIRDALANAWEGDPLSAFGSVIAANAPFDLACAEFLTAGGKFVEAVAAPAFAPAAVELLRTKPKWGKNVRLVEVPDLGRIERGSELRKVAGGLLVQSADAATAYAAELKVVGATPLPADREGDARLAQTL
ncbi:MAG TPA: bifunctional phosphoribosylaminoimidazolecarboxamide formyltransferase/IMP cyclohydrolase, partial [Planctomycetota bacterium]